MAPAARGALATQLYSVRSKRSWGIGDLTDLTDLAVWSASRHGAGYLLVNPLHAAAPTAPMEPSPYLPTSRRFANPLYLRVEAIPEYADLRHRGRLRRAACPTSTREPIGLDFDRPGRAWAAKRARAEAVHRVQRSAGRELAYAAFRAREGRALDDFATWCALAEGYGGDWHRVAESRCSTPTATVSPGSPTSIPTRSISTAGCSGSSTSSCRGAVVGGARRDGAGHHARPCGRCASRTARTRGRCRMCWRWA